MATAPDLSVIMSVYNGGAYLYPCVQSILHQSFANFEFLIVDDGSSDSSADILNTLANSDSRIKLVARENRGLVVSLNELIDLARAPLLARMDADDIAMPDRFAKQIAYLASHPSVGIVGSNTHDLDEDGRIVGPSDNYPLHAADVREMLKYGPPVCHPVVMMRTDIIRKAGGYRAAFQHAEDYDLWLRASLQTDIANLPERLLLYRRSATQISQKYALEQAKAAAVAWLDHVRCSEGMPSLFDNVASLPDIEDLDRLFESAEATAFVRLKVVERMRYSMEELQGPQFALMLQQVRGGRGFNGAGRTILRLARNGLFVRAFALAAAMAGLFVKPKA